MKRIFLHITFWLFYLTVTSYVNIFLLNTSYFSLPLGERIIRSILPELVILPVKIAFAYYIMYRLLPHFNKSEKKVSLYIEFIIAFIATVALYRIILFEVIYRYIVEASTYPKQTFIEELPRYIYRIIDIFSIVGFAAIIKLFRMRIAFEKKEKQLLQEKYISELQFLRSQTNPHFLFNTLNNIYVLARKKSDATADAIMQLTKLLRYMLYECKEPKIPLLKEIELIEEYMKLESIRYDKKLTVTKHLHIKNKDTEIAPLLILPLIENAYKYGAGEMRFDAFILVDITEDKNILNCSIKNSKDKDDKNNAAGIGLQNIKRQLELLYKEYDLTINNRDTEFEVKLFINLSSYAETLMPDNRR